MGSTYSARLVSPWNSPGKSTGVGCHSLLQGIFPTQGSNPGLLHCRQTVNHLSHQGSPYETSSSIYEDEIRQKWPAALWTSSRGLIPYMTTLHGLPPILLPVCWSPWCPAVADDTGPPCALSLACHAYLSCSVKSYFFLDLDAPWLICCTRMPPSSRWFKNLTQECSIPPAGAHLLCAYSKHCVSRASSPVCSGLHWCSRCSLSGSMSRKQGYPVSLHHSPPVPPPRSCLTSLWLISFFWKWRSYLP